MKGLNIADVRSAPIPLPPLREQPRIAEHVDDLLSIQDTVEAVVAKSETRCARLRQAILTWAFSGKLVDQDPDDEPASLLLERIKADRGGSARRNGRAGRRRKRSA